MTRCWFIFVELLYCNTDLYISIFVLFMLYAINYCRLYRSKHFCHFFIWFIPFDLFLHFKHMSNTSQPSKCDWCKTDLIQNTTMRRMNMLNENMICHLQCYFLQKNELLLYSLLRLKAVSIYQFDSVTKENRYSHQ